jgi:hypothetical protein
MSAREALVSINSNNSSLEKIFLGQNLNPNVKFTNKINKDVPYSVYLIDLSQDLSNTSQELINHYDICRTNDSKLVIVIVHKENIDIEKNHYFQKMLDDLGNAKPIHRLVFTKDIYQSESKNPVTYFDKIIFKSVSEKTINISKKGENLYYPLSIEDLVSALIKVLFLSNTSGKTFWLLGESFKDLEVSYLIKKKLEIHEIETFEINATENSNPKVNSLLGFSNQAKAELNWNPNSEFEKDLTQIVSNFISNPASIKLESHKPSYLQLLSEYFQKKTPKPQKKQLPKIKKILSFIALIILIGYTSIIALYASVALISVKALESSANHALEGKMNISVKKLKTSEKLSKIGDSLYTTISPTLEVLSPKLNEKIYNLHSLTNYTRSSLSNLQQTYSLAENLLMSLNSQDSITSYEDLSLALRSNLSQVYENINQIKFLTKKGKLPKRVENTLEKNSTFQNIQKLEDQIVQFIKISDIIPGILSTQKAQNILVLLQNSQVYQVTGGVIDYYLLITLDQGRLVSKNFYSPFELDALYTSTESASKSKQNAKEIPAPQAANLNTNPDFHQTSIDISYFIENTLKIKPDFIIAINDLLLKEFVQEEKLPTKDSITENIIDSNGAVFQKNLVNQYLDRLFNHEITLPVIGRSLSKMISENQIYMWSKDTQMEHVLSTQSFSGVIQPHSCISGLSQDTCHSETTYIAETDTTSFRKSPWTSRKIVHLIYIQENSIEHKYQIQYAPEKNEPSVEEINTIYHVFLPQGSTINKLTLNNLPASTKPISKKTTNFFDHYEIPLTLNPKQDQEVSLSFQTPFTYGSLDKYSYSITEYRQPGTTDPGIELEIFYPKALRPSVVSQPTSLNPSSLKLTLPLVKHSFGFSLVQNHQ